MSTMNAFGRSDPEVSGKEPSEMPLNRLCDQPLDASPIGALQMLAAGIAHELNQPLAAAANFLGTAIRQPEKEGQADRLKKLVELANSEILRAGEILRGMSAFFLEGDLETSLFSLNELVADALRLIRSRASCAGIALHYAPLPSDPVLSAGYTQIQQVLVNLIGNALEALASRASDKPEISIRANERTDGKILIQVLDNGPGFPPAIADRPLRPFMSTRPAGLGLGLVICRHIIEAHGCTLTLANRPEGGAMIEFTLPLHRLDAKAMT